MTDYRVSNIDEISSSPSLTKEKKEIDEAVGTTEFGFNLYTVEPGEQLSFGYHYHPNHEELFYVIAGEIKFETAENDYHVGEGEIFFVPKAAPQRGYAVSDTSA